VIPCLCPGRCQPGTGFSRYRPRSAAEAPKPHARRWGRGFPENRSKGQGPVSVPKPKDFFPTLSLRFWKEPGGIKRCFSGAWGFCLIRVKRVFRKVRPTHCKVVSGHQRFKPVLPAPLASSSPLQAGQHQPRTKPRERPANAFLQSKLRPVGKKGRENRPPQTVGLVAHPKARELKMNKREGGVHRRFFGIAGPGTAPKRPRPAALSPPSGARFRHVPTC